MSWVSLIFGEMCGFCYRVMFFKVLYNIGLIVKESSYIEK